MGCGTNTQMGGEPARPSSSVITYDQEDKILRTGNGFFVSESGTGLSDYTLFKDAYRAVVIDADGRQLPVEAILGANSIYDVGEIPCGARQEDRCADRGHLGTGSCRTGLPLPCHSTRRTVA